MPIATGVAKKVAYKEETTWGTLAGNTGAKYLRRVTADFNLTKDTYQSEEIRTDYQVVDMRHGVRRADGSLSGEFSPGSYQDFFAAALRKAFAAGGVSTGTPTLTVAGTGPSYTITRSTGSYLTDGFKIGDVIRIATASLNAANKAKNLLIVALTATIATVVPLNGVALVAEGPSAAIAAGDITAVGKKSYVPETGHLDKSFTIEQFFSDIAQSEVYTGMKVNTVGISIPATGMSTVDFGFMGKDLAQTGTTQYFTTPTASGTSGIFAGVNGVVVFDGAPVAVITDASLNINSNLSDATVLGSNSIADVFDGRVTVDGSMTVYFQDSTVRDKFKDEVEVSLVFALTTSNAANAEFVSIALPRVKINSFSKTDGETGITASCDFTALMNINGGNGTGTEKTTVVIQDSLAV